ncbi:hypothetical protein TNCV_654661 [Trichonephila clavipes]|nr:hypothetical protein TNCV_654661 [Trichonephila clavipes]
MGAGDKTGCLRTSHLSESYLNDQDSHIMPTAHAPYHHRASINLNSPLLTCRIHGFMRMFHTLIHPSARFIWKRRDSSDQATCFQSLTVQCRY